MERLWIDVEEFVKLEVVLQKSLSHPRPFEKCTNGSFDGEARKGGHEGKKV